MENLTKSAYTAPLIRRTWDMGCTGRGGALGLDKLLLIPAAVPPHKALPPDAVAPQARLAMAAMVADGVNLELKKPGNAEPAPSRWTGQGRAIRRIPWPSSGNAIPRRAVAFAQAPTCFSPDDLAGSEKIHIPGRDRCPLTGRADSGQDGRQARRLRRYGAVWPWSGCPRVMEISSTQVRELLVRNRVEARALLWCQVYGYILREGLYGVNADLKRLSDDDLRCASLSMVKAKRIPHIRGCEEEAVRLAERWGADAGLARRAGILHDCTKYLELDEQLALCDRYGIALDELERVAVKLLHAKTGAAIARHVFGEPEAVCMAIYWHTTGKADMDLLSKVLYLADYIEPSRADFPGLSKLRKLAYEDLDAALLLGCELTIEDMEERGMPVHTNTLQARDYLKGRNR